MLASQRVKDSEGNTVGFVVNGTFYTEDYILENIRYIENLSVTETGVISPEKELPEISYKEGIIEKLYRQKVQENPFVRDIQRQLSLWKRIRFTEYYSWRAPDRLERQQSFRNLRTEITNM